MSEKLAKLVLSEIPVNQLQQIVAGIETLPRRLSVELGGFCGWGCGGSDGAVCGVDCSNVNRATVGVIDPTNKAGISKAELDAARGKVLVFKDTLLSQARVMGIKVI